MKLLLIHLAVSDNAGFAALAHSFAARFLANEGRTEAERAATDWNAVITHVSNGITSDFNINNDQWETGFWYNEHYIYLVYPGLGTSRYESYQYDG